MFVLYPFSFCNPNIHLSDMGYSVCIPYAAVSSVSSCPSAAPSFSFINSIAF